MSETTRVLANSGRPGARPLIKLSSCVDFFDRDYDTLSADVDSGVFVYAWNIAAPGSMRREIRVWRESALAVLQKRESVQSVPEETVYRLILPARSLRSTELRRILSCSQELIHDLDSAGLLQLAKPRRASSGPNAFALYTHESVEAFLRARRVG